MSQPCFHHSIPEVTFLPGFLVFFFSENGKFSNLALVVIKVNIADEDLFYSNNLWALGH